MEQETTKYPFEQEFSVKKLLDNRVADIKYLLSFKKTLLAFIIVGGILGALAARYKSPTYTARLTFVIDDSKSSGSMGGLSSLAGQFGFSLDGLGGASGVLAGDNVVELLKSTKLIKATLQSAYDSTQTLADRYATVYKLSNAWLKYSPDGKVIKFPKNGINNTRLQDSLLHEMTDRILTTGQFSVGKADKRLGFFDVSVTMKDELLAQLFCVRMINQSTEFFISTKTKRLSNNVARLEKRADSLKALLNRRTYDVSSANQIVLDLNPAYTTQNANIEVKERDKIVLSTIFSETVKNLEASKTMLAQETPTVQVVDEPELPLKKNRLQYPTAIAAGIMTMIVAFVFFKLLTRKRQKTGATHNA